MPSLSPEALVSRANAIMIAWELGDTATYQQHCAEDVRMTLPAYGLDVRAFAAIWGVHEGMKPLTAGPLDLHTVTTAVEDGASVRARSHVVSRATGQFNQHAEVRFDFDDRGALVAYHQDVVWMARG
jgi:ketosteroid isomerase-like protein